MKRIFTVIVSVLTGVLVMYPQSGIWSGELEVQGMKLPLAFHLNADKPTMDSQAQGARGIPIQFTKIDPDSISIDIPIIGAKFTGKYDGNQIVGLFSQHGMKFPLTLTPGENKINRPQTPCPPFPYSQEGVSFINGEATLRGTLTLPENYNQDTPVVIMITGSGLQNRDEECFEHKPFAVIADALAKNGIASLRYDDRGFGESTGDVVNCTTEDLMKDALAGVDLLRNRFNKVGALGHSEGGTIALMLGADKKVDFIVSLAGMVISGRETLLAQNRHLISEAGYPKTVVDEYCNLLAMAFDNDKSLSQKLEKATLPAELKRNLQNTSAQIGTPYMKFFLTMDMRNKLGDIDIPVLALNGTKDIQVFHDQNLNVLREGLPSNPSTKIISLDNLNHMFQHCITGSPNEYSTIEETFSPEALKIITDWIAKQ